MGITHSYRKSREGVEVSYMSNRRRPLLQLEGGREGGSERGSEGASEEARKRGSEGAGERGRRGGGGMASIIQIYDNYLSTFICQTVENRCYS